MQNYLCEQAQHYTDEVKVAEAAYHNKSVNDAEWQRAFRHTRVAAGNRYQHPLKTSRDSVVKLVRCDLRALDEVGKNRHRPRLHDERILSDTTVLCQQTYYKVNSAWPSPMGKCNECVCVGFNVPLHT